MPAIMKISIHALRGEGDWVGLRLKREEKEFQSTPSVGRATPKNRRHRYDLCISIHALRGEGDIQDAGEAIDTAISIHALRGEGDCIVYMS